MTRRLRTLCVISLAALSVAGVIGARSLTTPRTRAAWAAIFGQRASFPHERHARLFPVCTGCHAGVPTGDRSAFYPNPPVCANCHDGVDRKRVSWTPPTPDAYTNLRFTHPSHATYAKDENLACASCHTAEGGSRMAVQPPIVGRCLECHAHRAQSHFVDAKCATCHVPLAETAFPVERILALPYPADHQEGSFLATTHGRIAGAETARCATCHTRQRCASCHVDAAANPVIARVPAAPDSMKLPRFAAHYLAPASHALPDFLQRHGSGAGVRACGTCHTRNDCQTCHLTRPPTVVSGLPTRSESAAPGVQLTRRAPASHEAASFATEHGPFAAARPSSCSTCHDARRFCADCHRAGQSAQSGATRPPTPGGARVAAATPRVAPTRASFHPPDFVARHASEAWGRKLDCSNCHNTAVFCRDCHVQAGIGTNGTRLAPGFHDAEPLWLIRHGQAARQSLESCASCHRQKDCIQCHSTLGAFHVNPHGPGFDPVRAQKKDPTTCFACHVTDPLGGGS